MNSFFSSISPNLAARIPQAQKHFSSFLPKQKNAGYFIFKPVTPAEIEAEMLHVGLNAEIQGTKYLCNPWHANEDDDNDLRIIA